MFPIADSAPVRTPPVATWALIGVNVLVFTALLGLSPGDEQRIFAMFGVVPARLTGAGGSPASVAAWVTILTSMFMHSGWGHLAVNMWTLWLFGDNVEERLGVGRYLALYLIAGVSAALVHIWTNAGSAVPTVGASGAISGVVGAYALLYPRARVIVMVPVLFLPYFFAISAIAFVMIWFVFQVISGTMELVRPADVGGVAWWAHIGGFAAGLALTPMLAREAPTLAALEREPIARRWDRGSGEDWP
ncbi:MAG: rhomboid family intramembrane serine protease [Planctomycetota bacterium]|nr:MAG: rhomboid family intramembrane serine protease [Planctomycetota bacterium]